MPNQEFEVQNGLKVITGNTVLGNTIATNVTANGTANVVGAATFANTVTGPGTTTKLDGFLIDCGSYS